MGDHAALFGGVIVLAWFLTWRWHRRQEARRKFRQAQQFRDRIQPPRSGGGLDLSLQEQSRPYRPEVYAPMLYPPGAWEEVHTPPSAWQVHVLV